MNETTAPLFAVGDWVEWDSHVGRTYGEIIRMSDEHYLIRYGPWDDECWWRIDRQDRLRPAAKEGIK